MIQNGPFDLDSIPGYKEAVANERNNRRGSFLALPEKVCGFELMPMTVRQFDTLRLLKNPLVFKGIPSQGETFAFLWF